MTAIHSLVNSPAASAFGWTLLHSLWQGAILAIAVAAVLLITRSPRIRYAAACAAMLALLASFCVTLAIQIPVEGPGRPANPGLIARVWYSVPESDANLPKDSLSALAPWLTPFWMCGVLGCYVWQAIGWTSVARMRRRGISEPPSEWSEALSRLCVRMRVTGPVRLLESLIVNTPVVIGHLRPVILIPVGLLAQLPAGQIEAILLHELAHIRRRDYLVNLLQRSIEGLFFYHPATWFISRVIRAERENCCDDAVVAIHGDAYDYAAALAALEQTRWSGREPAVAYTGGSLMNRIARLLNHRRSNFPWTPLFSAAVLALAGTAVMAAWYAAPAPQTRSAAVAAESPYQRWLDEDVVYIILDEERAAFLRLTADEERKMFIEQFWLRRDPTPGTRENEFKDEHYRRIAYSNQRFAAASGKDGWRTDRGHMYIMYGPPDEIESHPKGVTGAYPTDVWLYRHVDGIGENLTFTFIDRSGTRDYQLAPGKGFPGR